MVSTLAVGYAYEPDRPDVAIPEKYGLHQTVADTIGVGGVFRYLRTMPAMLEIGRDMQRLCPHALWLNYVNPMNMIMWTLGVAVPDPLGGVVPQRAGDGGAPGGLRRGAPRGGGLLGGGDQPPGLVPAAAPPHLPRGGPLPPACGGPGGAGELRPRPGALRGAAPLRVLRHRVLPPHERVRALVPAHGEDRERYTPARRRLPAPAPTNGTGRPSEGAQARLVGGRTPSPPGRQQVWESIKQQIAGEAPSTSSAAGSTARTSCTPWRRTPPSGSTATCPTPA